MGLIRNVTEEIKKNNRIYTEECKKIYEDIRFSKVQVMSLYNAILPIILFCLLMVLIGFNIYNFAMIINGKSVLGAGQIFLLTLTLVFFAVLSGIIIYYIIQYRKKNEPRYFVKDNEGEFEIYCNDSESGELIIASIVHTERHKVMFYNDNECKIYNENDIASDRNGFYEFLVSPEKVISNNVRSSPIYRYKKKKVKGNITYYYFSAFDHPMFGTRKPRSIKLENGIVKSICRQKVNKMQGTVKTSCYTLKYEYSHVNDDNLKIHIPKYVQEQAAKLKFTLPQESSNIVYDKE